MSTTPFNSRSLQSSNAQNLMNIAAIVLVNAHWVPGIENDGLSPEEEREQMSGWSLFRVMQSSAPHHCAARCVTHSIASVPSMRRSVAQTLGVLGSLAMIEGNDPAK